jgi:hypothetical protein
MSQIERYLPQFRLREVDHIDVGVPLAQAYEVVRRTDLARSPLIRAFFSLRTLPDRLRGRTPQVASLRLDDIGAPGTGFHILVDEPRSSFVVGAIGRFWEAQIPFTNVAPDRFAAFDELGWGKLAWEIRFEPRGEAATRVILELRVTSTDDASWEKFRSYFRLIGPFSRFIRRHQLELMQRELGDPRSTESERRLPGDDCLAQAKAQITDGITIHARPEAIWPWLVQMGCQRGGWYSHDWLDNGGVPSARRIVPEFQDLEVGDELAATTRNEEGFFVDRLEPGRLLLLHGRFDLQTGHRVRADEPRPLKFWEVSWAFVLEPLDAETTRLVVRVRADFAPPVSLRALAGAAVHPIMEAEQLRNLKRRAEGRLPSHIDRARDVGEGFVGILGFLLDLGTPFLRPVRSHWGVSSEEARRAFPGDERVTEPRWGWTHGIEIDAPVERVWPWIVQIGQDKAGFYSYQWLENLAGCDLQNADSIRDEWQTLRVGDGLRLFPGAPPLPVVALEPGRFFLVSAELDPMTGGPRTAENPERYIKVSWLFLLQPIGAAKTRFISRYRVTYGDDVWTRLAYGPWLVESLGFVMDRRMLIGIKERATKRTAPVRESRPSSPPA